MLGNVSWQCEILVFNLDKSGILKNLKLNCIFFRLAAKKEMQNRKLQERLDEMKKKKERDMAASRAMSRVEDDFGHTNEAFEDLERYWHQIKTYRSSVQSGNSQRILRSQYIPFCSSFVFLSGEWYCVFKTYRRSHDNGGILESSSSIMRVFVFLYFTLVIVETTLIIIRGKYMCTWEVIIEKFINN